jgi:hypothetical protein
MRASPLKRLWTIPLIWLPALTALWLYIATRDWAHTRRQIEIGHPITWPRAKRGDSPPPIETAQHVAATALRLAEIAGAIFAAVSLLVLISRLRHRRRRMRAIDRWELRLGRDDLANPYHVQEAFEGIAGAIGVRWYERLWRGPEHLALEIHRLHDASIRFVIAAPYYLEAAISGPLEDLYPDVELIGRDGHPDSSRRVIRLKKRASFVLSIQTTRNYEHAFAESLVALMAKSSGDLSVQLVLTPAAGFVHRRSRRLLKCRERGLQHADRRGPG